VRGTLLAGVVGLGESMEAANAALLEHNATVLDEIDYSERIPQGSVRTDVGSGLAPLAGTLFGREKAAAEAAARERRAAAEGAAAQLAATRRDKSLGLVKSTLPRIGVGALQVWPLHAPGPLPLETAPVGGPAPGLGSGGAASMVYRHYSVLDAVESSKRLEAGERLAAAEELANARGLSKKEKEALAGRLKGAARKAAVAAASASRQAAIAAQERAKATMDSMGALMYAGGDTRIPVARDRAVPLLSGGGLETEDYLTRVQPEREFERQDAASKRGLYEEDRGKARDRLLDKHGPVADAWGTAPAAINWDRIEGRGELL